MGIREMLSNPWKTKIFTDLESFLERTESYYEESNDSR